MTAFSPDSGDGGTMMMTPAAPDHYVHVVLLPVRRFLLHTTRETEHSGDYSDHETIIKSDLFWLLLLLFLYYDIIISAAGPYDISPSSKIFFGLRR